MASASAETSIGPMEIRSQINKFLKGTSSSSSQVNYDSLSSSALYLLRTVPVARHAVLEYYSSVFDEAIKSFLSLSDAMSHGDQNMSPHQRKQLSALHDVTGVLLSFIKSNPEAWAPVVSSWALNLLGQLSSKYAAKRGIQHATSLNEVLQMWLACQPARLLMEISTECFAAMVGAVPDMCVDSLLEASVIYSPHFDWVVAHIGSCFPRTIITRVLNCGLKDFCNDGGVDKPGSSSNGSSRLKVPKMASVVGILGHLASKHGHDIRKALMALFEASLQSEVVNSKVTTLPFLLQLASMSDMLLHILATDLIAILTPAILNQLHQRFVKWKRASPADYNGFLNLVVHLIMKSRNGTCDIIGFILDTAAPADNGKDSEKPLEEVKDTCVEIIHILMFELQRAILSRKVDRSAVDVPLLVGLANQSDVLTNMLIKAEGKRVPWLQRLLIYTALHAGESCAASILSSVIYNAHTQEQLGNMYSLKEGIELGLPAVITPTLEQVFNRLEVMTSTSSPQSSSPEVTQAESSGPTPAKTKKRSLHDDVSTATSTSQGEATHESLESSLTPSQLQPLKNLERIVAVEKKKLDKKVISCSRLMQDLENSMSRLSPFLLHPDSRVQRSALSIVNMVGFPVSLGSALLTRMAGAVAQAFFTSLHLCAKTKSALCTKPRKLQPQGGSKDEKQTHSTEAKKGSFKDSSCMTRLCMSCIDQLCSLPYTRSLLIHYLVEGATQKEHCHLFGGKWSNILFGSSSTSTSSSSSEVLSTDVSTSSSPLSPPLPGADENNGDSITPDSDTNSLLQENRQQGNHIALPRFHSKVYHGGVIKQVNKEYGVHKPLPKEQSQSNILTLVETLWMCCRDQAAHTGQVSAQPSWGAPASNGAGGKVKAKSEPMDVDMRQKNCKQPILESSARTLGCVIVDILTLDSLYNDVHWQDPDFRKVTTERDILVWKRLGDMSFLWSLLQEFSSSSVFLFYVSPVIRSLVSVVMNHLEVSREPRMRNCPQQKEAAVKLVYCLAQGSWVPSPLSNVSELFPYVTPYEGYLLLLTIWRYIKERPPSEFEFEMKGRTCDSNHMFVVNSIIHANIDNIGHLCTRIFNM